MTRIVAGSAKGRVLRVPARGTRPTSERVREALFSRLEHMGVLEGARVLDLYAGTGALGLEALSRGAASAVLVDSSRQATRLVVENVRATGMEGRARAVCSDAAAHLRGRTGVATLGGDMDLVLVDPPYDIAADALAEVLDLLGPWLTPDALVAVETSSRAPEPTWPPHLVLEDRRVWGETVVWFAGPPVPEHGEEGR